METISQLKEIMKTEAELIEAMHEVMKEQQDAIIRYESDKLNDAIQKQQELLSPIELLEKERVKMGLRIMNVEDIEDNRKARETFTIERLLPYLNNDDADDVQALANRLRKGTENIVQITRENRRLLEHSRKFVRENIRILTGNYSKQFVDQKL